MTLQQADSSKWDERYAQPDYYYGTQPNDFLVSTHTRIPGDRVLCLAEGEGRNAAYLASLGYQVTAVDGSAVGLQKAQHLATAQNSTIATICTDLANFKIEPGYWDGIVSCYCHLPPAIRTPLNRQIITGLTPGGVLILEGFSKAQLTYGTGGPPTEEMLFSLDELREELNGLEFTVAVTTERDVLEGRGHTGLASVVQIVGVKPA